MEPSVHVKNRLVVNCPCGTAFSAKGFNDKINCKNKRNYDKYAYTADFGPTADFVHND